MRSNNLRYVITGASFSGKTSLIRELEKKGHLVVYEAARALIEEEISKGKTTDEIRKDESRFQEEILKRKIEIEKKLPSDKIVFLDRGIPDSLAYNRLLNTSSLLLQDILPRCSYKKIFFLDRLKYRPDDIRIESAEDQSKLHLYLEEAYKNLGFTIIKVPVMTVEERVEFVLNNL